LIALGVLVMNLPGLLRSRGAGMPALDPFAPLVDSGTVAPDSLPTDSTRVLDALRPVQDPEIEIGIVELGLVHRLRVDSSGNVALTLTLTVPECPFGRVIGLRALAAVTAVPGVRRVEVRLDPSTGWTPERLGPEARERYHRLFGHDSDTGR
jgi:metal-sulfur cluster biosynthetic enzyme